MVSDRGYIEFLGFTEVNKGCCGGGPYNGLIPCLPTVRTCPDRAAYLFWDPFHPIDKANGLLAREFFHGGNDVDGSYKLPAAFLHARIIES